jgi:hypothetical protein
MSMLSLSYSMRRNNRKTSATRITYHEYVSPQAFKEVEGFQLE